MPPSTGISRTRSACAIPDCGRAAGSFATLITSGRLWMASPSGAEVPRRGHQFATLAAGAATSPAPPGTPPPHAANSRVNAMRIARMAEGVQPLCREERAPGLGRDGLRLALFGLGLLDDELAFDRVDRDRVARVELALEEHLRERVRDLVLDRTREWTCPEVGVVADSGDVILRRVRDDERDLLRGELLAHAHELELDDLANLLPVEGLEDDGRVNPVQELRPEEALHLFHDAFLHPLVRRREVRVVPALGLRAEAERGFALQQLLREVARHDHDRVAEVDAAALRIRKPAFVEDLQQHVEDLGVRLLDLVEEDHAVRLAADGLSELAALFVTDITGRGADEARHVVPLHVVGHIYLHHVLFAAEHELGEDAGEVGLTGTGRSDEEEDTDRPARILEAGASATDRPGDRRDRDVLSDDATVESVLHLQELLGLLFG